jgi:hypothetical protein
MLNNDPCHRLTYGAWPRWQSSHGSLGWQAPSLFGRIQTRDFSRSNGAWASRVASPREIGDNKLGSGQGIFFEPQPLHQRSIIERAPIKVKMIRQEFQRVDPKRRAILSHKKKQFAAPAFKQQDYPHRLNFYETPPTAEITLEQFEQWAIDRLKSMNLDDLLVFLLLTL